MTNPEAMENAAGINYQKWMEEERKRLALEAELIEVHSFLREFVEPFEDLIATGVPDDVPIKLHLVGREVTRIQLGALRRAAQLIER